MTICDGGDSRSAPPVVSVANFRAVSAAAAACCIIVGTGVHGVKGR